MSMMKQPPVNTTPTMPAGNEIAVYSTYLKAQKAVDALSDEGFEVQTVTIVGHDLHMVERVTGRLTYPRVAFSGFASGAWFGLFVGLLMSLFSTGSDSIMILPAMLIGGAFGLLFSIISYALQRGKRDFTSQSQIVAARYVLLCLPQTAGKARTILAEKGLGGDVRGSAAPQTVVSRPAAPTGAPEYGVRVDGAQGQSGQPVQPVQQAASGQAAPIGRPLTYGEALDAQRRAARQSGSPAGSPAPAESVPGSPAPETSVPVNPAPANLAPESSAPENSAPENSVASPSDPTEAAAHRRPLKNPDNPFSAPKDEG